MRGKSWSIEEEKRLCELVNEGLSVGKISIAMGKTHVSVMNKIYHLGLSVVDDGAPPKPLSSSSSTPAIGIDQVSNNEPSISDDFTTQLKKGGPLPTIEEQLYVLNAAIVTLQKPGHSRVEIARLSKIIEGVKVYNDLFPKFVNYRGLENRVVEIEKRFASEKNQS